MDKWMNGWPDGCRTDGRQTEHSAGPSASWPFLLSMEYLVSIPRDDQKDTENMGSTVWG